MIKTREGVRIMLSVFMPVHSVYQTIENMYNHLKDTPIFTEDELEFLLQNIAKMKDIARNLYPRSNSVEKSELLKIYVIASETNDLLKNIEIPRQFAHYLFDFRLALNALDKLNAIDSEISLALDLLIALDLSYRRDRHIGVSYKDRNAPISYKESGNLFSEQSIALLDQTMTIDDFIVYIRNVRINPSVSRPAISVPVSIELNKLVEEFCINAEINQLMHSSLK